jgi:hypothetical protein
MPERVNACVFVRSRKFGFKFGGKSDKFRAAILGNRSHMTEYQQYREDACRIRDALRRNILALSSVSPDKRQGLLAEIEPQFRELQEQVDLITEQKIMWDSTERDAATKFVQEIQTETRRLGEQYSIEKSRSDLFAGARMSSLAGGSDSERAGLLQGRDKIGKQGENLRTIEREIRVIQGTAEGILGDLGDQRGKEAGIDDHVNTINHQIDTGNRAMSRIEWREKKKTIAIWVVVVLAIIGLSVFLYFVFK